MFAHARRLYGSAVPLAVANAWKRSRPPGCRLAVIHQHPLAYRGIEGVALRRGWAGDYDREFVQAWLAEGRRLLDDEVLAVDNWADWPWTLCP
jgi:hypothetical protein